jgi:BNR repeat-containing family member
MLRGRKLGKPPKRMDYPARITIQPDKRGDSLSYLGGGRSVRRTSLHLSRGSWIAVVAVGMAVAGAIILTDGPSPPTVFNDNGGWNWIQDERAILDGGKLLIGSVSNSAGTGGASRRGNIELVSYDLARKVPTRIVLSSGYQNDDHGAPALLVRPDGHYLAVFTKHNGNPIEYRISTNPHDATSWQSYSVNGSGAPSYSSLVRLSAENGGNGRIYDFYRGSGWDSNILVSDDDGATWSQAGRLLRDPQNRDSVRPYVKYTSNGRDTVHFITTEAHPRDHFNSYRINTSIYYGTMKDGKVYDAADAPKANLSAGPAIVTDLTKIYDGTAAGAGRAWSSDIQLDRQGRPYVAFTVHMSNTDHRYGYARFDGTAWQTSQIAYGGRGLYGGEDDYTGNLSLNPDNPNEVYISTNVNPVTGAAVGTGKFEIYRGVTRDLGLTWKWTAITRRSSADNLRPVMPPSDGKHAALVWLQGTYTSYTNYNLKVVGRVWRCPSPRGWPWWGNPFNWRPPSNRVVKVDVRCDPL